MTPDPQTLAQTSQETLRRDLSETLQTMWRAQGRGAESVMRQPLRGFDVACVVRLYDRQGNFVAKFEGFHSRGGHAEEVAMARIAADATAMRRARGGHMIVTVTQDPCKPRCRPFLKRMAQRLEVSAERFEAYVPASPARSGATHLSGRTTINRTETTPGAGPYLFRAVNVLCFGASIISPLMLDVLNEAITRRLLESAGYDPVSPSLRFRDEPWFMRLGRVAAGANSEGSGEIDIDLWLTVLKRRAWQLAPGERLLFTWEWPVKLIFSQQIIVATTEVRYTRKRDGRWSEGSPRRLAYRLWPFDPIEGPETPSLNRILDPALTPEQVKKYLDGLWSLEPIA